MEIKERRWRTRSKLKKAITLANQFKSEYLRRYFLNKADHLANLLALSTGWWKYEKPYERPDLDK